MLPASVDESKTPAVVTSACRFSPPAVIAQAQRDQFALLVSRCEAARAVTACS